MHQRRMNLLLPSMPSSAGPSHTPSCPAKSTSLPSCSTSAIQSASVTSDFLLGSTSSSCQPTMTSPSKSSGKTLSSFVTRTSKTQQQALDEQVASFIYATNSSFRLVEHPQCLKLFELLRPGYKPPAKIIGGRLLDTVYQRELHKCKDMLKDETVSMSLDGWSNVHNTPMICASVTSGDSGVYLSETIDTSGQSHTAEYLVEVAMAAVQSCEQKFGCRVRSLVTDNAANVAKMRSELEKCDDVDLITYGCSAHLLNLLAHDLEIPDITEHVLQVIKYFRNNHFALAAYRTAGGSGLILPQVVRWNTMANCLEAYISNWPTMLRVCEENRDKIPDVIRNKVANVGLKRTTENLHRRLKPIAIALDKIQASTSTIADAVEIWKTLEINLASILTDRDEAKNFKKRLDQALTPVHLVANVIHPRYQGKNLTEFEHQIAMNWLAENHQDVLPTIVNLKAKSLPFQAYMFADNVIEHVQPLCWWTSQREQLSAELLGVASQLLTAVASSADIERVFSSFGLVQSKLQNKLGNDKAGKLVFLFKAMNNTPIDDELDVDNNDN